jgi:hypothetical protein
MTYFLRYEIQIGKGKKGGYKVKYTSKFLAQATILYNGINIGNGYKKRLVQVFYPERRAILEKAQSI